MIRLNRNQLNLFLDIVLVLVFVVAMEEHFSGLAWHEALGVVFAAVFTIHIVLHWDWIVSLTRTLFRKVVHESRLNYALNWALFVDAILVTVSGIVISRTLGLHIALSETARSNWIIIHAVSSQVVLIIIGLHVAMHWKWIATNARKYLIPHRAKTRTAPRSRMEA